MAVGIPLANPTVPTVDQEFGPLIPGDISPPVDCLLLGLVHRGRAAAASWLDRPPVRVRHDMLVVFGHGDFTYFHGDLTL